MDEIEKGYRYRSPAPETTEFMRETKTQLQNFELSMRDIQNDIKNLVDSMKGNGREHDEIKKKIDDFICSADNRYASKEVETVLKRINWMVLAAVILAILAFIMKDRPY